jgi:hypothetical protein
MYYSHSKVYESEMLAEEACDFRAGEMLLASATGYRVVKVAKADSEFSIATEVDDSCEKYHMMCSCMFDCATCNRTGIIQKIKDKDVPVAESHAPRVKAYNLYNRDMKKLMGYPVAEMRALDKSNKADKAQMRLAVEQGQAEYTTVVNKKKKKIIKTNEEEDQ